MVYVIIAEVLWEGHYYAYVKNANNNWYEFNDATVNIVNINKLKTPAAYCFFYRKKK